MSLTSKHKLIYRFIFSILIVKIIIICTILGIDLTRPIPVVQTQEAVAENTEKDASKNDMSLSMDRMEQKDNFYAKPENSYLESEIIQREREKLIHERQKLENERQHLEGVKTEIDQKIVRLSEIQETVQKKIKHQEELIKKYQEMQQTTMDKQFKHLLKIYTSMPSKKSAKLIDKLDIEIAIRLLSKMKGEQVGQILSYVPPEKAANISEHLAKTN
jgi:flagellar motility protein MotE (MotC chaperone)